MLDPLMALFDKLTWTGDLNTGVLLGEGTLEANQPCPGDEPCRVFVEMTPVQDGDYPGIHLVVSKRYERGLQRVPILCVSTHLAAVHDEGWATYLTRRYQEQFRVVLTAEVLRLGEKVVGVTPA